MKEYKYKINGNDYAVCINEVNDTTANITVNGEEFKVEWEKPKEEKPVVKVQPVATKPAPAPVTTAAPAVAAKGNAIKTPLPGVIIDVKVNVGDVVKKGETVVVLEAMKMENNINADRDGKVVAVQVAKGDTVADGAALIILE